MALDFSQFTAAQKAGEEAEKALGEGKRPRLDFAQFAQEQAKPIQDETVEAAQDIGTNQTVSDMSPEAPQQTAPNPRFAGIEPMQASGPLTPQTGRETAGLEETQRLTEATEAVGGFARDEGLPTALGTAAAYGAGILMAGASAPVSVPMLILGTAAAAGAGGFAGELTEQEMKARGILPKPIGESNIRTFEDRLEQSAWRGVEEGAFSLIPDVVMTGSKAALRRVFPAGTDDVVKQNLQDVVRKETLKRGQEEVLTVTDVADVAMFEMMDAVASNSLTRGALTKTKETQKDIVMGAAKRLVEEQQAPASLAGLTSVDDDIANYVGANFETMNAHAVAALVRKGVTEAQTLQKNIARAKYKHIGELMEPQLEKQVQRRVSTGILDSQGNPTYRVENVTKIEPAFPVNLVATRQIAETELDQASKLVKEGQMKDAYKQLTPEMKELLSFGDSTDFATASTKLSAMKSESRNLVGVENAANRKRLLDNAITQLNDALEASLKTAEDTGIVGPNGVPLSELKAEADAVWKEQADSFGNKFMKQIIDNTDPKNGSPEELARLFMKDTTHALKIVKALELGGDGANVANARQAIKGSIAEAIFMPFDKSRGRYTSPAYADLEGRKEALLKLYSQDEYDDMISIANSLARVNGENRANVLAFAQQATESGQAINILQDMAQAKDPIPNVTQLGATLVTALGAGKVLTSPTLIRAMAHASDETVPPYLRRQHLSRVAHQLINWYSSQEESMTEEQLERWEARLADNVEYHKALRETE